MTPRGLFAALGLVCLLNGLFSPVVWLMWQTAPLWMPDILLAVPGMLFFLSPLVLAVLTMVLSGVPAALYEQATGAEDTGMRSLSIWLGTAVLLSLPAAWTLVAIL